MVTLNSANRVAANIARGYALPLLARQPVTFGDNLRRIRGDRDQKAIAVRMGVDQARLSNWETDRYTTLTLKNAIWLAWGYECSVEELVVGLSKDYDELRDDLKERAGRTDTDTETNEPPPILGLPEEQGGSHVVSADANHLVQISPEIVATIANDVLKRVGLAITVAAAIAATPTESGEPVAQTVRRSGQT